MFVCVFFVSYSWREIHFACSVDIRDSTCMANVPKNSDLKVWLGVWDDIRTILKKEEAHAIAG